LAQTLPCRGKSPVPRRAQKRKYPGPQSTRVGGPPVGPRSEGGV
jgi:hypothetical protein